MRTDDPGVRARRIIDANLYMVLGTADGDGHPWVSPVYYAPAGYRELIWVSRPEARHSRNLAVRPQLSIVIFDSSVPIGGGDGVYMEAHGHLLAAGERADAITLFSERCVRHGGRAWTVQDVEPPSELRLYRATATEHYVLEQDVDRRIRVTI